MSSICLAVVMCLSISLPAFATHIEDSDIVTANSDSSGSHRAHDVEERYELVSDETKKNIYVGYAAGQMKNGTVFHSKDGPCGFFWTDSGGNMVDISLSLSFGPLSVSASTGSTGMGGMFISARPEIPCKLYVARDFNVKRYKVYERPIGSSMGWCFRRYETEVTIVKTHLYIEYL